MVWQTLADQSFSCSGAPINPGAPVTVKLAACAGTICEVALNASSDGARWRELNQRFMRLAQVLEGNHGAERLRGLVWLDCNADGLERCRDLGRLRMSDRWSWPDGQSISLVLDGGPLGGAPTLGVVYRTAEVPKGKP